MTSSHHAPYGLGYTRTTMALNRGKRRSDPEQTPKTESQFGLQAATRLHEAGIASNRRSAYCGEYVPGPCTHRPALWVGTHERLPQTMRRKAGMTSNHHAPYDLGYTRTTMGVNRRKRNREVEQTRETLSQFGS